MSYGHAEMRKESAEANSFGLKADSKIILGKMHYRCDVCTIGSQDSKSKVRKMNDQKLTRRRRISKVTHSRKQWTEIEVGNSLVLSLNDMAEKWLWNKWGKMMLSFTFESVHHSSRKIMLSLTFESVHILSEKHSLYTWLYTTWYYLKLQ